VPTYPDRRGRYSGVPQWEINPGTPNADNRTKTEAKTISAARVPDTYEQNEKGEFKLVAGNKTPRDNFRVTTAPKQPESQIEQPSLQNKVATPPEKPLTNQSVSAIIDVSSPQSNPTNS
jgi:hypothetical protein